MRPVIQIKPSPTRNPEKCQSTWTLLDQTELDLLTSIFWDGRVIAFLGKDSLQTTMAH